MIDLSVQVIDRYVQQQEQAGANDAEDDANNGNDDDDDDDVEPSDHADSDSDDIAKATSDAPAAGDELAQQQQPQQGVDDADYEWSINISSAESEDEAADEGFAHSVNQLLHFFQVNPILKQTYRQRQTDGLKMM